MIERVRQIPAAPLALAAAATLAVAVGGGAMVDRLWLALMPGIVLLVLAVGALHTSWDGRDGRLGMIGAAGLLAGCIGLLAMGIAGLVVVAVRGVEPAWLSVAALVSGVTFVIGDLFGVAAARRRTALRGAAILFAIAIPLGLAIDCSLNSWCRSRSSLRGRKSTPVSACLRCPSLASERRRGGRGSPATPMGWGLWRPKRQRGERPVGNVRDWTLDEAIGGATAYMLATLFPIFAVVYAGLSEAKAGTIHALSTAVVLTGPTCAPRTISRVGAGQRSNR